MLCHEPTNRDPRNLFLHIPSACLMLTASLASYASLLPTLPLSRPAPPRLSRHVRKRARDGQADVPECKPYPREIMDWSM